MSVEIPADCALISFLMQARGQTRTMAVTFGARQQVPATPWASALETLADNVASFGHMFVAGAMSSDYSYLGLRASCNEGDGIFPVEVPRFIEGTNSNPPLPPQNAVLVRKRTALGGKRFRGRFYLPPAWFSESGVDHLGNLSGGLSPFIDRVDTLMEDFDAAGLDPVLLHSPSEASPEDPVPPPTLITSLQVQTRIATQRRRLR